MSKFEICYLVAMCAVSVLCLLSHILIATIGSSRCSKIFFCVVSCGALLICVAIFVMLSVKIDFYPARRLFALRGELHCTIPLFVLTIVSSSEFTGLLYSLKRTYKKLPVQTSTATPVNEKYPYINNERKAGKVMHESYKISEDDK